MKKIVMLLVLVAVIMVPSAFAQVRLDMGLDVPFRLGALVSDLEDSTSSTESESYDILTWGVFPFPSIGVAYQFDIGPIKIGGGLRGYSIILETLLWPYAYAELEFSRLVLNANVGGLGIVYFGIISGIDGMSLIIPDVSLAVKLGKSFRLGVGVMALTGGIFDQGVMPYTIYMSARFSNLFD